jgi:surface protein
MFYDTRAFNQPIGNWDTSSVTTMYQMFYDTRAFNQPIGNWNTSSVNNTYRMFSNSSAFNQDIGDWDVSSVTNMEEMFYSSVFNQDIGDWDVSNVALFGIFILNSNYSPLYMDSIYNKWSQLNVVSGRNINFTNAKYTAAGASGRAVLVNTFGWTIIDGGQL